MGKELKIPRLFKLKPHLAAELKRRRAVSKPETTETAIVEAALEAYFEKREVSFSKTDSNQLENFGVKDAKNLTSALAKAEQSPSESSKKRPSRRAVYRGSKTSPR
jgi:hypothetical protein